MRKFTSFFLFLFVLILGALNLSAQTNAGKEILWTADWSPNGKYYVYGGNIDSLKIYKAKSNELHSYVLVKNTITRAVWHPKKNIIAVTTQFSSDAPFLLNVDTGTKIELEGITSEGSRAADWNATGEFLAIGDNDGQISIYTSTGELVKRFPNENSRSITAIDWHPTKNIFITVSEKIRIFDIDGKMLNSIKTRQEDILMLSVAWHKSGKFFVTGDYGDDKTKTLLQYWNEEGQLMRSIDISKGEIRNLRWNKKGTRVASSSDALRIWDIHGNLIFEGKSPDYLWGLAWNKRGNKIITTSLEQRVFIWKLGKDGRLD